jgi:hypothetical protein
LEATKKGGLFFMQLSQAATTTGEKNRNGKETDFAVCIFMIFDTTPQ